MVNESSSQEDAVALPIQETVLSSSNANQHTSDNSSSSLEAPETAPMPLNGLPRGSVLTPGSDMLSTAAAVEAAEAGSLLAPLLSADSEDLDGSAEGIGGVMHAARRLTKLAIPLTVQSLASMMLMLISTIFVGHLNNPLALSAVVLSTSLYGITGVSITMGLASAMDTLCGQAFGAQHYKTLGEVQQRARLICWTCCVPISALWYFGEPILVKLGQGRELAHLAAGNLRILIPCIYLGVMNDTTKRYLASQRVLAPSSCCYIITLALSPLYNWLLIFRLELGIKGAAYAVLCCSTTNAVSLTLYQTYRDRYLLKGSPKATWGGYNLAAFTGWGKFFSLALPSAAMMCLEWWVWELMIFMSGLLPHATTAVGVMGLAIQVSSLCYMIPASLGSATTIRVANLLGAGHGHQANVTVQVSSCIVFVLTLVLGGALCLLRDLVARAFTEDAIIRHATAVVLPAVAASFLGDGLVTVMSAVLRASGRQAIGAMFNIAGYWGLCLPLAWVLGFHYGLGVLGFWVALIICIFVQAIVFGSYVVRFDWHNEVQRARALTLSHRAHADAA